MADPTNTVDAKSTTAVAAKAANSIDADAAMPKEEEEEEEEQSPPFRLFDLPPELRLRIYEFALAPSGTLCLTSTKTKRFATQPAISPALLRTCRQIHHEAAYLLYTDNEVVITVDAHDTCWPTISSRRLPQHVLQKILHMCVILDCTNTFWASYADVDFDAFAKLIQLKTLRITVVYRKLDDRVISPRHQNDLRDFNVVAQILERVPADTKLSFGTVEGSQQHDVVRELIAHRTVGNGGTVVHSGEGTDGGVIEALATDLEAAAIGVEDLASTVGCFEMECSPASYGVLDIYAIALETSGQTPNPQHHYEASVRNIG